MNRALFCLLSMTALAGCANREAMTSGIVGCPTDEVIVTNIQTQWTTGTWTASCRGKTFYCTATEVNTVCSPELKGS